MFETQVKEEPPKLCIYLFLKHYFITLHSVCESTLRRVPTHVLMFIRDGQRVNHMLLCSSFIPLRMLRLSFPQKASRRGSSPLTSSPAAGLSSGELGPRLRSSGALVDMGGGEDIPEAWGRLGERVAVGGGEEKPEGGLVEPGGGEEMEGQ